MKRAHEKIIQADVEKTGRRNENHGAPAVPLPPVKRGNHIIGRDKRDPGKADPQIKNRALESLRRRLQKRGNRAHRKKEPHRQHRRNPGKHRHRISGKAPGRLPVAATDRPADADRRPHRQPHNHHGQHVHQLRAHRNRRGGRGILKTADDEKIGHAIERL